MPFAFRSVNDQADLSHLLFKTFRFWETLLFVDSANYGGVEYADESSVAQPQLSEEVWNVSWLLDGHSFPFFRAISMPIVKI
jgi:hypothetical protein